jgi:diacylglycerol kinase family enzyme
MIVIANARTYGTGALINDIGKIDDGHFEVIAIKRVRFWQIFSFIGSFFIGNISQLPFVKAFSLRYVKVYNLDDQPFQIDGEYQGKQSEIEVTIDPGALKIIVPD